MILDQERYRKNLEAMIARGLVPGAVVRLMSTIKNPAPDRRQKHDWRKLEEIPVGQRFQLVYATGTFIVVLELRDTIRKPLQLGLDSDLFERLLHHLEPIDSTLDDVLHFRGLSAHDALQSLIDQGHIDLTDIAGDDLPEIGEKHSS